MADKIGGSHNLRRFRDMGDGSFAEVVTTSTATGAGGSTTNPNNVNIVGSSIAVPVNVQSLYRTQVVLTSAALAASTAYISPSVDALNFRRITGRYISDVAGSNFLVQQSDDGVIWDNIYGTAPGANTLLAFDTPIYLRYVRLYYLNSAAAQTAFRLSGYLAAA